MTKQLIVAGVLLFAIASAVLARRTCPNGFVYTSQRCYECGRTSVTPDIKIIGGIEATPYSWPAQAQIQIRKANDPTASGYELCGGTLISRRTILTAAHCIFDTDAGAVVDSSLVSVYLGIFDNPSAKRPYGVSKIIKHPKYDDQNIVNDIALLILSKPAELSKVVQLACLPSQSSSYPGVGVDGYAVGWGVNDVKTQNLPDALYNIKLPIVSPSQCSVAKLKYGSSQVCAGKKGSDTCQGDSGGPLYVIDRVTKRYVVSGVTSYGVDCGVNPGVYTRVSYFVNWIEKYWVV